MKEQIVIDDSIWDATSGGRVGRVGQLSNLRTAHTVQMKTLRRCAFTSVASLMSSGPAIRSNCVEGPDAGRDPRRNCCGSGYSGTTHG